MSEYEKIVAGDPSTDVPTTTPEAGETYQRIPEEPSFDVIHLDFQHPQHRVWAGLREARGLQPPFYVRSKRGEIFWVPWPGAKPVSQQEAAWEMDLLAKPSPKPK